MKKLILFLAAVCYTAMMQAEIVYNVPYIDENGVEQICEKATVVSTLSGKVIWTEGWYLVKSTLGGKFSIECVGAVHLILGDGSMLEQQTYSELNTSHLAGIKVSGGSSLTIYGQKDQTGLLIARGGEWAAAIGGGDNDNGNNITINSGRVKAYGGNSAAAIGGGLHGSASNITINGGAVIAMSVGGSTSAIGSGSLATFNGAVSSNIFIADRVKAMVSSSISNDISITSNSGYRNLIEHSSIEDDIADDIAGMCQFASIDFTTPFFAALDKAAEDVQDDYLLQFVNAEKQKMVESKKIITYEEAAAARDLSKSRIKAAKKLVPYLPDDENIIQKEYIYSLFDAFGSLDDASKINNKMYEGIGQLQGLTAGYNWGKADAFGTLGTKQNGPAVILTDKDGKEFIFYSPKSVEYIKVNEE